MIEWTNGKIAELISLARGAAVLLAIAMVGVEWTTRQPTLNPGGS